MHLVNDVPSCGVFSEPTQTLAENMTNVLKVKTMRTKKLYLLNIEAFTVFCSVVKHEVAKARKKCRVKHEAESSVSPHFFSA